MHQTFGDPDALQDNSVMLWKNDQLERFSLHNVNQLKVSVVRAKSLKLCSL